MNESPLREITKAVIPVAGWGTRFLPFTKSVPKELLPLLNRPMIEWLIEECRAAGIKEIILVTRPEKAAIEKHFECYQLLEDFLEQNGKTELLKQVKSILPDGMTIKTVHQKTQGGLGHAFLQAKELIEEGEYFAGLLPDEVLLHPKTPPIAQLTHAFNETQATCIGLFEVPKEETKHYGVAQFKTSGELKAPSLIQEFVEKPKPSEAPSNWMLPGRYIMPQSIFSTLENQKVDAGEELQLTDALTTLCKESDVYGVGLQCCRFDTGRVDGFVRANAFAHLYLNPPSSNTNFDEEFLSEIREMGQLWRELS